MTPMSAHASRRARLALPAAAAIVVALAGCSSESAPAADTGTPRSVMSSSPATAQTTATAQTPTTVAAALDQVASATADARSVRGTLTTTTPEGDLDGTFAYQQSATGMLAEFTFTQGGQEFAGVITPKAIFISGGELAAIGGGKKYLKVSLGDDNPLGRTYADMAKGFTDAADLEDAVDQWRALGFEAAGTDDVDGVTATKYTATFDPANPPADAPAEAKRGWKAAAKQGVTSVDMTLWVGPDGLPLKFSTTTEGKVNSTTTVTYEDWGADVKVSVPPAREVADLGGLLG